MSEDPLICFCAPVLAGIKTASLFSWPYPNEQELDADLAYYNTIFQKKGLSLRCLGKAKNRRLLYVCRASLLKQDLSQPLAKCMLKQLGYPIEDVWTCLDFLTKRMRQSHAFPHEIGLFLGYPAKDVLCFMENKSGKACHACCYTGMWQAFHNPLQAQRLDLAYKHCIEAYMHAYRHGYTLENLSIAM